MSDNKNKKNKYEKGYFGYINHYKKKQGIIGFLSLIMVFVIYFTGIIIYHSNKTIFTVMAAVSVLPAAKYLIMFFIVIPYKTSNKEIFEKLIPNCKNKGWLSVDPDNLSSNSKPESKATMISDLIFTYEDHITNVEYIIINRGHVFAYSGNKKTDKEFAREYIKKILDNSCNYKSYKFYDNKELFLKDVINDISINTDNSEKVLINDMIIARKILPFVI